MDRSGDLWNGVFRTVHYRRDSRNGGRVLGLVVVQKPASGGLDGAAGTGLQVLGGLEDQEDERDGVQWVTKSLVQPKYLQPS